MSEDQSTTKGQVGGKSQEIITHCPLCGCRFAIPLDTFKTVTCASVDDGGCGADFRVLVK